MLDYHDMVKKVEADHGIKFRGYGRTDKQDDNCEGAYLDFWHLICGTHDIENPCEIEIDLNKVLMIKRVIKSDAMEESVIDKLGKEEGEKYINNIKKEFDAVNCLLWKIDIIACINRSYPDAISDDMKIKVHIDW